jgi:hypothetical protein
VSPWQLWLEQFRLLWEGQWWPIIGQAAEQAVTCTFPLPFLSTPLSYLSADEACTPPLLPLLLFLAACMSVWTAAIMTLVLYCSGMASQSSYQPVAAARVEAPTQRTAAGSCACAGTPAKSAEVAPALHSPIITRFHPLPFDAKYAVAPMVRLKDKECDRDNLRDTRIHFDSFPLPS